MLSAFSAVQGRMVKEFAALSIHNPPSGSSAHILWVDLASVNSAPRSDQYESIADTFVQLFHFGAFGVMALAPPIQSELQESFG